MLRSGTQDSYIRNRVNMHTARSHAELTQMDPKIRAQSFFSARVAEVHILDRLREVSDRYSRGEIGLGEARNLLKDFLKAEGYDPHKAGLKNLASTARLNLVMRQNAAMANAAAEWKRMHDPDAMTVFPYVRYHARKDSRSRDGHKELDGKIFRKDDPFLKTHTPPWEFNCRCWLEEITAKEADREPENVQKPTPPEDVTIDSASGFSFDPEHAFETFDLASVKDATTRESVHEDVVKYCAKNESSMTLYGAPPEKKLLQESYREPGNIKEIEDIFTKIENNRENLKPFNISVGKILPEHAKRLGLTDFNEDIQFLFQPENGRVGVAHWQRNHSDTLNSRDAIRIFRLTIWNPYAELKEDLVGRRRRIAVFVKDVETGSLTNVWVIKDSNGKLVLQLVDSWNPDRRYIDNLGSQHKKKHP